MIISQRGTYYLKYLEISLLPPYIQIKYEYEDKSIKCGKVALQLFLPFCATRKIDALATRRETQQEKKTK